MTIYNTGIYKLPNVNKESLIATFSTFSGGFSVVVKLSGGVVRINNRSSEESISSVENSKKEYTMTDVFIFDTKEEMDSFLSSYKGLIIVNFDKTSQHRLSEMLSKMFKEEVNTEFEVEFKVGM